MIEAQLVFKNPDGNTVPVDNYSFTNFMAKWASGELQRDIEVQVTSPGSTTQLSAELWDVFLELHHQLSLADKLLACKKVESDTPRFSIYPEGEHQYVFPSLYIVGSTYGVEEYAEGVQNVVYTTLCHLLQEITNRDNAAVLKLLHESSQTKDVIAFKQFTPIAFTTMRDEIWKWALPVTSCVGTAEAFSRLDIEEFAGFGKLDAQLSMLAGIELVCVGSSHDFIYPMEESFSPLFMCSAPSHLGVRCVREPLSIQVGGFASMTIATAILSNKAVQAGIFV